MKRPKLSKTKQLRRDLRAAQAALDFQTDRAARLKASKDATIQQLEQRLQSLCGASFNYDHDHKAFHACIYIDRRCLEDSASTAIHSAVMQLVELIYREDFQDRTLNMKRLLEDVDHLNGQEFDHQLYPHIREIDRNHPAGEPPIYSHTYFRLAKQFLAAFLQMGAQPDQNPSHTRFDKPVSPPKDRDLPADLRALLVCEYHKTPERAAHLVATHTGIVAQMILHGPISLRGAAMHLDHLDRTQPPEGS